MVKAYILVDNNGYINVYSNDPGYPQGWELVQ